MTEQENNKAEEKVAQDIEEVKATAEENNTVANDDVSATQETEEKEVEDTKEDTSSEVKENSPASEDDDEDIHDDDLDSDDDEEDEDDAPAVESTIDLQSLSLKDLISEAVKAKELAPREGLKRVREIRTHFEDKWNDLRQKAEEEWREKEDSEGADFKFEDGGLKRQFNTIFKEVRAARVEEKDRIEKEKITNLKVKQALLEELKSIIEKDETEKSLNEVKEIQRKWRQVRMVPHEHADELWKTYHFYLDKFYDNHSINIELKELDRKKNLEVKIDLCKKVDELLTEKSLKKSFILLNKYTEEFKNTGPVPREFNEEIWTRFKGACDKVYEVKRAAAKERDEKRKINLEQKEILVEKASLIAAEIYDKPKVWKKKTDELDELFQEWKKIGPVPQAQNQKIWKAFRSHFNEFYKNKSAFFKQSFSERKDNLKKKEALCEKAEELAKSADFNSTTKQILQLQEDWKNIGPVPDKASNAIWKRFRKACDQFFDRKQNHYKHVKEEEQNNLKRKEELINKTKEITSGDLSKDDAFKALQEIQKEWNGIGYVPFKKKDAVQKAFNKASNDVIAKHGLDKGSVEAGKAKDHYEKMAQLPGGSNRLNDEIRRIKRKINFLNGEVETWENNIGFFAQSKTANKLKDEIEGKIEKANKQISKLKAEIKEIRKIMDASKS